MRSENLCHFLVASQCYYDDDLRASSVHTCIEKVTCEEIDNVYAMRIKLAKNNKIALTHFRDYQEKKLCIGCLRYLLSDLATIG